MPQRSNPRCLLLLAGLSFANVATAQVLFDNGGVITTPTGACIPAGSASSQLQTVGGVANGLIGIGLQLVAGTSNRIADDFTVTGGNGWNISTIDFLEYQSSWPTTISPIVAVNVRIWNANPGNIGAQVVFGDVATNRLASSVVTTTYRIGAACGLTRQLFRTTVNINAHLAPGTYWLDLQAAGNAGYTGPWSPLVTITGSRGKIGANAVQTLDGGASWIPILDEGPSPDFSSPPVAQDFPFTINGIVSPPACYADCDHIGGLTGNDFQCFLNAFVAGASYANCDNVGGLTGNDFQCFLNAYVAGCS